MWLLFAAGSAFFAGITAILAKCGIRNTDSTVATAVRTIVVLIMSMMMVLIVGSAGTITEISGKTWLFLTLSGLATGASWLCYFRALQVGDVNKVVPVDKSSTVLAMLLALIFLHEEISLPKLIGLVAVACGIFLMIEKKESVTRAHGKCWLLFAVLSAVFAALTSILGKRKSARYRAGSFCSSACPDLPRVLPGCATTKHSRTVRQASSFRWTS